MTVTEDTKQPGRRGALQKGLLHSLSAGPMDRRSLRALFRDVRGDNFSRALSVLTRDGLVTVGSDGALRLAGATESGAAIDTVTYDPGNQRWLRAYTALTQALLDLADGNPIPDLFPPPATSRAFGEYARRELERKKLARKTPHGWIVNDAGLLKQAWADERAFCALLGWAIPDRHASSMRILMHGGTLREEAEACAHLFSVVGQWNMHRRAGAPMSRLIALRAFAVLPASVREAMEAQGVPLSRVRELEGLSEADMLRSLSSEPELEPEAPAPEAQETDRVDPDELMAACVKLCAATANMVSEMSRKLDWLANELGYKERAR